MNKMRLTASTMGLAGLILGAFMFNACDDSDAPNSRDLSDILWENEWTFDPNVTGQLGLTVTPSSATASSIGQEITFSVSGGQSPYHWGVSKSAAGSIRSVGPNQAIYRVLAINDNDIAVHDSDRYYGYAEVSASVSDLAIVPSSATVYNQNDTVNLKATGGTPPYNWVVVYPGYGTLNTLTGSDVTYTRTTGNDVTNTQEIVATDADADTAQSTIQQN